MVILKNEVKDNYGSYIDAIHDSSNILKTTYFPHRNKLFIHFVRGGTYSYTNISETVYNELETSESIGKYFQKNIARNDKYQFAKEFTLTEGEINDIKNIIKEHKNNEESE